MTFRMMRAILVVAAVVVAGPVVADDLSGSDAVLCTAVQATICDVVGDCEIGPPWNWNVPQFIEIDFGAKTLSTTQASGENRSTPIRYLERSGGLVLLQGVENGRAFSFVIVERTGMVSVAVAREDLTVSVFGACTPLDQGE
ncbi:MAG: hypothetical protein GY906_00220 [bacterium]|nr:hypothetical protein [bacterium]